jgi:hypothetical protein
MHRQQDHQMRRGIKTKGKPPFDIPFRGEVLSPEALKARWARKKKPSAASTARIAKVKAFLAKYRSKR